jgi:hypothetical protein
VFTALWGYAAANKLLDINAFRGQLSQSPLLLPFYKPAALIVPVIEVILAWMLAFSGTRLFAFYGSFYLMSAFSWYIIAITRFSDYVPCSCGGILEQMSWNAHLWFNLGFVLLAAIAVLIHPRRKDLLQ